MTGDEGKVAWRLMERMRVASEATVAADAREIVRRALERRNRARDSATQVGSRVTFYVGGAWRGPATVVAFGEDGAYVEYGRKVKEVA